MGATIVSLVFGGIVYANAEGLIVVDDAAEGVSVPDDAAEGTGVPDDAAEGVSVPDDAAAGLSYSDGRDKCRPAPACVSVDQSVADHGLENGWYVVRESAELECRMGVTGDVKLILCDDAKLVLKGGVHLCQGSSLTIYGQKNGTGVLAADRSDTDDEAGIGGNKNEDGGRLIVYGGSVYASGGEDAAGIGGGCYGKGGVVEINDGFVEAKGCEYGAGIGGGKGGVGGEVTIGDGHVIAYGDGYERGFVTGGGAGIGGGDGADGGTVTVYDGDVEVFPGWASSAGIGGGCDGNGGTFTMYGGKVRVYKPESSSYARHGNHGAGIGGGRKGSGGAVNIYGGEVTVDATSCAAGIGGGYDGAGGTVLIQDAKLKATSLGGAAIGGGQEGDGGEVTIRGSEVEVTARYGGAGIGGGYYGGDACSKVTIENSTVVARSEGGAAAIGGGACYTMPWSYCGKGGEVIICNSDVTATCTGAGAGIGGGEDGDGGRVVIEGDSHVDARSASGAAIGRGEGAKGVGSVELSDTLRTVSYDGGARVVPAAERADYCRYRNHVKVEPCDHEQASYERTRTEHTSSCPHCLVGNGGARAHDFGEGDTCATCGYTRTHPEFVRVTPATAGTSGLTFWYRFPEDECAHYEKSRAVLSVGGKRARKVEVAYGSAEVDSEGLRGFTMPLSAIELGQRVDFAVCYGDDERVEDCASIANAIVASAEMGSDKRDLATALRSLASAQANFCHYMQVFTSKTNGWKLGEDYRTCDICYPKKLKVDDAREGLGEYKSVKRGAIKRVTMSVSFDALAALDVSLTPKDGCELGEVAATCAGKECSVERLDDGRLHVRAEGIAPLEYAEELSIVGTSGGPNASFEVKTSLLSYAGAMMGSDAHGKECDEAMAATYWYYRYAVDYAQTQRDYGQGKRA